MIKDMKQAGRKQMNRFDDVIERKGTNSLKYDFALERNMPVDILPMWVADMDFRAPEEVLNKLHEVVSHGIFGYSDVKSEYYNSVAAWFLKYFNYKTKAEWLVKSPGVVFAINAVIRALTKEGDAIMIQQPVYYPFADSVLQNNRRLVNNELKLNNGRYEMDLQDFEQKVIEENVKLFILCSPHNPVGRVWTKQELTDVGNICLKHNVIVISDEIHCDFTYPEHKHTVFATISEAFARQCIICSAPSKTFNLAGLQTSNMFIQNDEIRDKVKKAIYRVGYCEINTFGLAAAKAAYDFGDLWLQELKEYLKDNLTFAKNYIDTHMPKVKIIEPEGTYLLWVDFSKLSLSEEELTDLIVNKAKLWLDGGSMFGTRSGQFQRVNIACPRSVLEKALEKLDNALKYCKNSGDRK